MKLTYHLASWLVAGNCAVLGLYGWLALGREDERSRSHALDHAYVTASRHRLYAATGVSIAVSAGLAVALSRSLVGRPVAILEQD